MAQPLGAFEDSSPRTEGDGDVFQDLVIRAVMLLLVFSIVMTLLGFTAIYYADEYAVPSWNERSVPAPLSH